MAQGHQTQSCPAHLPPSPALIWIPRGLHLTSEHTHAHMAMSLLIPASMNSRQSFVHPARLGIHIRPFPCRRQNQASKGGAGPLKLQIPRSQKLSMIYRNGQVLGDPVDLLPHKEGDARREPKENPLRAEFRQRDILAGSMSSTKHSAPLWINTWHSP